MMYELQDIIEAKGLDSSLDDGTTELLENLMKACCAFPRKMYICSGMQNATDASGRYLNI